LLAFSSLRIPDMDQQVARMSGATCGCKQLISR
jgi:hypothetical protein